MREAETLLCTRYSNPNDTAQLIELARLFVAEQQPGVAFAEDVAFYTFAGAARADPIVVVLVDNEDDEVVGFMTARLARMSFSVETLLREDCRFVRSDQRCAEADDLLLQHFHMIASNLRTSESYLYLGCGDELLRKCEQANRLGYKAVGAQMKCRAVETIAAAEVETAVVTGASVH